MIVNRGNMGEVCVLFVTLLYVPDASSAQSDAPSPFESSATERTARLLAALW